MKNGVIASIVLSIVLTLTLAITTIATAFSGAGATTPSVYLAYRTGDVCEELKDYKKIDFDFDISSATSAIVYNSTTGEYEAVNPTEETINASAVDKSGRTYDLHIDVYAQGTGVAADDPWVIANAGHVLELSSLINDDDASNNPAYVVVKANVDMAKKSNEFRPIGTVSHKYTGNIEGNNKTISNLTINVTNANKGGYIDSNNMLLGLFGYTSGAQISNVSLTNEKITVASDIELDGINRIAIGGVAGVAMNSTITTNKNSVVNSKINAISYAHAANAGELQASGVGGVVGYADTTEISNLIVNTNITANRPFVTTESGVVDQTQVGGVVGYAWDCPTISGLNVTLTAKTTYNNGAKIGGVVAYLRNSTVSNTTVAGVGVSGNETFKQVVETYQTEETAGKITMVGGVASFVDSTSSVENTIVNNASIDVKAKVGGVAFGNEGTIKNAKVNGYLTGFSVGGVADINEGTIDYTDEFSGKTVCGTLKGIYVGGLVAHNAGTVNGYITDEANAQVDVYVKSVSGVVAGGEAELMEAIKNAYVGGLAAFNANTITNFNVKATVADGLNMAGLVSVMGKVNASDATARTAILSNINAESIEIISNNSTSISTTYSIGGAVNNVYAGSTIDNVNVNVSVNKNAISTHKYGAAFVGGLVARIYENNVTITNNTVSGSIYTNYTNYTQLYNETEYDQMNIGGFIGTIASEEENNSVASVNVNNMTISGNTVSNLEVTCAANIENIAAGLERFRNIASFVGLIYNANGTNGDISLADNTLENVTVYANKNTFTTTSDGVRYGDAEYGRVLNRIAGSGVITNVSTITNSTFAEL